MERKTARLTVLVDPEKKKAFEALCARQDVTPSQVVRQLIRNYLAEHDVSYGATPANNPVVQAHAGGAPETPARSRRRDEK